MPNFAPVNATSVNAPALTIKPVSVGIISPYSGIIGAQITAPYTELVTIAFSAPYTLAPIVSAAYSSSYSIYTTVAMGVQGRYDSTTPVVQGVSGAYAIATTNPVAASTLSLYMQLGVAHTNLVNSVEATLNGVTSLAVSSAHVSIDEGAGLWRGSIGVDSLADYLKVQYNDTLSLSIYGELYEFLVDSKSRGVSGTGSPIYTITVISLTATYASPRTTLITKTWASNMMASDIAKELVPSCVWTAQDWLVPSAKFSASLATPLKLVGALAAVIGAKLNCTKSGLLSVDDRYSVRPKLYATTPPAHTLFDVSDLLSISEQGKYSKIVNSIRLSNSKAGFADNLSFIGDTKSKNAGELRLRLSPWRSSYVLKNSQHNNTSWVTSTGVVGSQEITEVIPIINGVGVSSKPITTITSWVWMSEPLGSLSAILDSKEIRSSLAGVSLAKVTYTSRYISYRVTGSVGEAGLYYVENI